MGLQPIATNREALQAFAFRNSDKPTSIAVWYKRRFSMFPEMSLAPVLRNRAPANHSNSTSVFAVSVQKYHVWSIVSNCFQSFSFISPSAQEITKLFSRKEERLFAENTGWYWDHALLICLTLLTPADSTPARNFKD